MTRFVRDLTGGLVIVAVGGLIGIAQNAVRDDAVALVPTVTPIVAERATEPAPPSFSTSGEMEEVRSTKLVTEADVASAKPTDEERASGVVTAKRLRTMLEAGTIIVIDARSEHEFNTGRIPDAINIPYDEFVDYFDTLKERVPVDATVVCYCESVTCEESENLATELKLMGYTDVLVYKGGWKEWTEIGHPTEE